ncbi:unnamed protein product, partial [marine sediment metagenome]
MPHIILRWEFNSIDKTENCITTDTQVRCHTEDFLFIVSDDVYSVEIDMRQDITEDARYAQFAVSSRERLLSFIPFYKKLLGRAEIKEEIEKYGEFES